MMTTDRYLSLLGGFRLTSGQVETVLPLGAERLLAYLSLQQPRGAHRAAVGEELWRGSDQSHAAASLRSALWQVRSITGGELLASCGPRLMLSPAVKVDFTEMLEHAVLCCAVHDGDAYAETVDREFVGNLMHSLLPNWQDDWLQPDQHRWDQVRVHALEAVARRRLLNCQFVAAHDAALGAVTVDPLRDSAHRLVIEIFIAEGNFASAVQHYLRYRTLVQEELGVRPSSQMTALVRPLRVS